jgi:hypothetical protein
LVGSNIPTPTGGRRGHTGEVETCLTFEKSVGVLSEVGEGSESARGSGFFSRISSFKDDERGSSEARPVDGRTVDTDWSQSEFCSVSDAISSSPEASSSTGRGGTKASQAFSNSSSAPRPEEIRRDSVEVLVGGAKSLLLKYLSRNLKAPREISWLSALARWSRKW